MTTPDPIIEFISRIKADVQTINTAAELIAMAKVIVWALDTP